MLSRMARVSSIRVCPRLAFAHIPTHPCTRTVVTAALTLCASCRHHERRRLSLLRFAAEVTAPPTSMDQQPGLYTKRTKGYATWLSLVVVVVCGCVCGGGGGGADGAM